MSAVVNCETCWRAGRFPYHDAGPCPPDQPMAGPSDAARIEHAAYERGRTEATAQIVAFLRSRCREGAAADVERFEADRLKSSRVPEPIMAEIRSLAEEPSPITIVPVSGELKALLIEHPTWDIARAQDELDHRKRLDVCLTCGGEHANHTTGKIR